MARLFTRAASDELRIDVGSSSAQVWGVGNPMAVVRKTSDGVQMAILSNATSADAGCGEFGINASNQLFFTNGTETCVSAATVLVSEGWMIVGATKAAGTVACRFHKFIFRTGAWTHATGTGTVAPPTAAGAGGTWRIGSHVGTDFFDGDIATVMYVPTRTIQDGEAKRMVRGLWWAWTPTFLREFPAGSDEPVLGRTCGRDRTADTLVTGTTRSTSDPPGFRYSPMGRRGR